MLSPVYSNTLIVHVSTTWRYVQLTYNGISEVIKRLLPERPDLKQHHTIAPYVTVSGVFIVIQSLHNKKITFHLYAVVTYVK